MHEPVIYLQPSTYNQFVTFLDKHDPNPNASALLRERATWHEDDAGATWVHIPVGQDTFDDLLDRVMAVYNLPPDAGDVAQDMVDSFFRRVFAQHAVKQ